MDATKLEGLRRLTADLDTFSTNCLRIADKQGRKVPFVWNRAQRYIHEMLEQQRAEIGYVRAIICKGRQQGVSTYVAARFYHRTTTAFGQKALIVGHEQKSTDNLFTMVKRYHENNPLPVSTGNTNAKELVFDKLDSGYKLATAGTQDVARGNTAQLAHLSEYAFWSNPELHMAGLGNIIGNLPGTEVIVESTANGLGNGYHNLWQAAVAGEGEYIAIFVPWYWEPTYVAQPKESLELSPEDVEYQETYGLTLPQMQWRANKLAEYGPGFAWVFSQEYPACPELAFRSPTGTPLIGPTSVMAAVNSTSRSMEGPLIIGCDPASDGEDPSAKRDRTAIVFRRGRTCFRVESYRDLNSMEVAGKLMEYVKEFRPDMIFIDKGGIGAGIYDRLVELNAPVTGVMFGSGGKPTEPDGTSIYLNKRAEIWYAMKEWLEDQPCRIPNDAALIADISAPQPIHRSDGRKQLEGKKEMAKRGIRSPDLGDALALTFADVVMPRDYDGYHLPAGAQRVSSAGY